MATSPEAPVTAVQARGHIMTAVRMGDTVREEQGRRDLAAAKIATYIERTLEKAPPLSPAQVRRLSALLKGSGQ